MKFNVCKYPNFNFYLLKYILKLPFINKHIRYSRVYTENASITAMQEQSQVLSMQMVSCEERLARAETDLRVERECRSTLQAKEVQWKDQINQLQMQIQEQSRDVKQGDQAKQDLKVLRKKYQDLEKTLEELGIQLSTNKLLISEMKDKQRLAQQNSDPDGAESNGDGNSSWTPDKLISQCKGCNRDFSITRRKHHCRKCGQIFCNNCSDHVIPLSNTTDGQLSKPVRVCDTCWFQLNSAKN